MTENIGGNARNPSYRNTLSGEDPRIFRWNDKLYISYNTHFGQFKKFYFAGVDYHKEKDMFYITDPPYFVRFESEVDLRHEKNWIPFEYCQEGEKCDRNGQGKLRGADVSTTKRLSSTSAMSASTERYENSSTLFFIYSIQPHRIVQARPLDASVGTWQADTVHLTALNPGYEWKWGEMRGGTPALLIDAHNYLTFFHSQTCISSKYILTYVMWAYTFSR